jgi:hypothetical protein
MTIALKFLGITSSRRAATMLSFNSWFISIAALVLAVSLPPGLYAQPYQQAYNVHNSIVLPPCATRGHPNVVPAPWSHELSYSFQPVESVDDESGTDPRDGSVWLFRGFPTNIQNCSGSGGLSPPKKIDLPPDVCLYGTLNNLTFLLREMAVCEDGTEAWLAMYMDPTCHEFPQLINPMGIVPGTFCLTTPPFLNDTHIIMQFSMIFRCVDAVERSMPKKFMNADLDVPVIEDPPKRPSCCE